MEKVKNCPMIELYIQRYIQPNKGHKLLYRLTYYCNPEKIRKASYVEIFAPKNTEDSKYWDYGSESCTLLYRSYNGIKELLKTGKRITQLANMEYGYRLMQLQLNFMKESGYEKYWLLGLESYELDNDTLKMVQISV